MSRRFCRLYHGSAEDIIEELERGERPRSEFSVEELRAAVINLAGQVKQLQRAQREQCRMKHELQIVEATVAKKKKMATILRKNAPQLRRLLREA